MDLTFLIDTSSTTGKNLSSLKTFAKRLVHTLPINRNRTQCALLTISNTTGVIAYLNQYPLSEAVLSAIDSVQLNPGRAYYYLPIQYLSIMIYADGYGRRLGAARVALLLLDSSSYASLSYRNNLNATVKAADDARRANVTLIVVCVGNATPSRLLTSIAGSPDNIVYAQTYDNLTSTNFATAIEQKIQLAGMSCYAMFRSTNVSLCRVLLLCHFLLCRSFVQCYPVCYTLYIIFCYVMLGCFFIACYVCVCIFILCFL